MTWGELAGNAGDADSADRQLRCDRPAWLSPRRSHATGWVAVVVAAVALLGACSRNDVETVTDLAPPPDMEECDQQYVDDKIIDYTDEGDFAAACVDEHGEMTTPVPARLSCTDGRHLVFNDYAWGFENDVMTRFQPSDQYRLPPEDVALDCLMEEG